LADFRLNTIGFVFQDYHLFPRLTSAENVAIPLILKHGTGAQNLANAMRHGCIAVSGIAFEPYFASSARDSSLVRPYARSPSSLSCVGIVSILDDRARIVPPFTHGRTIMDRHPHGNADA
jgi:ABC-type sugar transport system ATPase subunit